MQTDFYHGLLSEAGSEGATKTLERVRALVADTFKDDPVPVTVSIGAVSFTSPPVEVAELVKQADAIMYAVKASGKNLLRLEVADQSTPGFRSSDSR